MNRNGNDHTATRRQFLKTSSGLVGGLVLGNSLIGMPNIIKSFNKPNSLINGVQIGTITYSFRELPDQSAEATLKYVLDCGISAIELMGDPAETFAGCPGNPVPMSSMAKFWRKRRDGEKLTDEEQKEWDDLQAQMKAYNETVQVWRSQVSMAKFEQFRKMYNDAGVSIYAFKPNAFGKNNTDAEIDYGLRAAKALGASHVTLEHPGDDTHTLKLGKMGKKYKIYVAYHGHEQQTPTLWDTALAQSKYNAMNLDFGHFVAAGNPDPLKTVMDKHDRIRSMHLKDRQMPEHGKGNLPWGTGDTPLTAVLQLMRDQKYKFPGTVELEYQVPKGSDPVTEVSKCLEYCIKALA
ncbi:MAG: sugar phosphate isomerase/epimerase [Saprospiraceae bacterium]|nr:sugar phosphate isomerase/epimerase [Saprospiraceae bacterium]MCB9318789.1 sugar phosphate isomerase/epimerase [Lewinellaceae bacterium]